jgi:hypothetical protein
MKNLLGISATLLLALIPAVAMAQREVGVRDLNMVQSRTDITIEFDMTIGRRAVAPGKTLTIVPTLTSGAKSVAMTPVVVRGRRAEILRRRGAIAGGVETPGADSAAIVTRNGGRVGCSATIPFEDWMAGASLVLRGESEGCTLAVETLIGTLAAEAILPAADFTFTDRTVVPGRLLSTGEKLAERFPFVQPARAGDNGYTPVAPQLSRTDGGLTVFFRQGGSDVDADYRANYRSLVDLLSVIDAIDRSADCAIDRISITGFASPEGSHESNMRLSLRRAEAVRRVIEQNAPGLGRRIGIMAGGEDWEGLRELVTVSPMPRRDEVLRLLDAASILNTGDRQWLENEIMRIDNGLTYRYMERVFFPELREATFIVVYYKDTE